MKNGTTPGILISDLMSGDGPHQASADHFLLRRCEVCGYRTNDLLIAIEERFHCESCVSNRQTVNA